MKVLYFAWVRQRTGVAEEDLDVPAGVITVRDLTAWLAGRGEGHAAAFADLKAIRVAVDHEHADLDASITNAREIAFFPPMTGG